jgi:hypothetical protein
LPPEPFAPMCIKRAIYWGICILMKKTDDVLARAIAKTCGARDVLKAVVARPEFQVEADTPDSMLELLMRLDAISRAK